MLHVYPPLHGQSEGENKIKSKEHFSHFGTCFNTPEGASIDATESNMHCNKIKTQTVTFLCFFTVITKFLLFFHVDISFRTFHTFFKWVTLHVVMIWVQLLQFSQLMDFVDIWMFDFPAQGNICALGLVNQNMFKTSFTSVVV